jgi:hypothetical protein
MLQPSGPAERLTIIMENYSGQNKNNVVLHLYPCLIEMNYFRTVDFVFYMRRHTKNACDRLFDEMNIRFHKDQAQSYRVALEIFDEQPNVHIIDATEEVFKDFDRSLDWFYSTFDNGTTHVKHIFKLENEEDVMEIQCYTHDGAEVFHHAMLKHGGKMGQEQLTASNAAPLETLKPSDLREIKQVELIKKWRNYADPMYLEKMCPEPSYAMIDQVKRFKL